MSHEWIWVAAIFAVPVLIFGGAEAVGFIRRRRRAALARRSKDVRPRPPGSRPGRAG